MKKILIGLFCCGLLGLSFVYRAKLINKPLLLNEEVTQASLTKLWTDIVFLHRTLPIDEPIEINLNSYGGNAVATIVFLERIDALKEEGRVFIGTIYGHCYSACGTIFALMDIRYMTPNAVYMQHSAYTRRPSKTGSKLSYLVDIYRLQKDANLLKRDVFFLMLTFTLGDFIGTAKFMKDQGFIDGIVRQPNIGEI